MRTSHPLAGSSVPSLRTKCLLVLFFLCTAANITFAQSDHDLIVTPTVIPPYSPNLDVWMSNPSRMLITILNTTGRSMDIRLAGNAKNTDGSLSMETKNDAAVPVIHIGPNASRQLNLNDFRIFDANVVRFKGTNTTTIARTHLLPDGIYTLCIQALDYRSKTPLSAEQCATFEIRNADAPMLIAPANRSEIDPQKSPIIQFQWIPPVQAPPTAIYELAMMELPGNMEAEAAMRSPQAKQAFRREVRGANMMTLRSGEFNMESGKKYAWRIHITDPMNTMAFRNDGYSEAWSFNYGGGIIVTKLPKVKMPDTLIAGTFAIVVQSWDETSKSTNPALPSGTGCIKFNCAKSKKLIPPYWKDLGLITKSFDVVSGISDSASQLHINEASLIDKSVKVGDKLSLDLPSTSLTRASQLIDRVKVIDWLKTTLPAGCILVSFHDVEWTPPNKKSAVLTGGTAYYPTIPPTPPPPAMLVLDSGFTLAIDSLVLTASEATVQGKLLLPKNIISADTCTRAFVKLPKTTITSDCEFYKEVITQDSAYGKWWLGETGVLVKGTRYIVDFSSTLAAAGFSPPLDPTWKGVVLRTGETIHAPTETIISNRGYAKAWYSYENAKINSDGFEGRLGLREIYRFTTLEPYGYVVALRDGRLMLAASTIIGGGFQNGRVYAPEMAVRNQTGGVLEVVFSELTVQPDMDLFGGIRYDQGFRWGEFSRTTGTPRFYLVTAPSTAPNPDTGVFYLGAAWKKPYYPADTTWHHPVLTPTAAALETQAIQGLTFPRLTNREFVIYTPDVPTADKVVRFKKEVFAGMWMNIIRTGIHGETFITCDTNLEKNYELGDSLRTKYQGEKSFNVDFGLCAPDKRQPPTSSSLTHVPSAGTGTAAGGASGSAGYMPFQFVESAVWNSELAGQVKLPAPASINVAFKNMMFTSTADCAGGQVDLSKPDTLPYWGVALVAKDTGKSAGIICARLGVIYLTAAGIAEPRHYSKPFWLTWGEFKADGNLGKLYFDYNSVGQRMDGFPFAPALVRLSDYQTASTDSAMILGMKVGNLYGFLHAYGCVSVHFFGGKMLSLSDYRIDNSSSPYLGRWMRVQESPVYGAPASDTHWQRNWAGGIANFDYTKVLYDSAAQDGFFGTGTCTLLEITGGISSVITIRAERMCFSMSAEASHDVNLSVVANFSSMGKIWGCGCIVGESLERVVVGGELSSGFGVGSSLAARGGAMVAMKLSFLPTQTKISIMGDMYVLLATSVNAEVSGMAELTEDHGVGFVEGYLKGTVRLSTFMDGISAEGELQWHFGLDFQMIQGRVAVGIYGPVSLGMEAGVFLGNNCPKDRIWVTDGINGRFSFNKGGLPARLSGMYAFISVSSSVNLYVVSGGFEVYVGVGAFLGTSPPVGSGFGVIGNVGVRIWGEILGGLVSASAWGNLQFIVGIPPAFEGSIGLEACVLWVFCGSVDIHCGYNHDEGFYLY